MSQGRGRGEGGGEGGECGYLLLPITSSHASSLVR